MRIRGFWKALSTITVSFSPVAIASPLRRANETHHWVSTWATAIRDSQGDDLPPAPFGGSALTTQLVDTTTRQTFRVSLGAERFRIELSNVFSDSDLVISEANVALPPSDAAGTPDIDVSTIETLTFGSATSIVIPAGSSVYSDPFDYTLEPLSNVALSVYTENGQSGNVLTGHPGSRTASWFANGNLVKEESVSGGNVARWFFAGAIEAWLPESTSSIVVLGDSITDGRGSVDNENNRWTDLFAEELQKNDVTELTVNNQGIGGNSIVSGGLGLPLLDRYVADALDQTGVKYVMIFEGVNDIGNSNSDDATQTQLYNDLTSAYAKITTDCKEQGLVTIGATITPFEGSDYYTPAREATRKLINDWIMTSGTFDFAVDFSAALADGDKLQSEYDSGDGLHPSVSGYQKLAESIPLDIFN